MNAAFLLMTTALVAGADAAPSHAPASPAPVVVHPAPPASPCGSGVGGCSGGCGTCYDACCEKEGLFTRLRNKLSSRFSKGNDCCDPCGDTCSAGFGSKLRGRLKGMFRKHDDCCDACAPACDGCASGTVVGTPILGTPAPAQSMPKAEPIGEPREKLPAGPKDGGKPAGGAAKPASTLLTPRPLNAPALQLAPTSAVSPF